MPQVADRVLYFNIHTIAQPKPLSTLSLETVVEQLTSSYFRVQEVEVVYSSGDTVLTTVLDVDNSMGTLTSGVSLDECIIEISPGGSKGILGTPFMVRDCGQWIPDECHFKSKSDSIELMDDILKRLDALQKDIKEVFGDRKPPEKSDPPNGPDLDLDRIK